MSTWEARNLPKVGDRVELVSLGQPDQWTKLEPGTKGTVAYVDSTGTIHVKWESGSTLGLNLEFGDRFKLIAKEG